MTLHSSDHTTTRDYTACGPCSHHTDHSRNHSVRSCSECLGPDYTTTLLLRSSVLVGVVIVRAGRWSAWKRGRGGPLERPVGAIQRGAHVDALRSRAARSSVSDREALASW
jgi:hypothetical protein